MFKCETRVCRKCSKQLPIECFNLINKRTKEGTYRTYRMHTCKECLKVMHNDNQKKNYALHKDEINAKRREERAKLKLEFGGTEFEIDIPPRPRKPKPEPNYKWVERNLFNYGDCYVRDKNISKVNLVEIEEHLGCKLAVSEAAGKMMKIEIVKEQK